MANNSGVAFSLIFSIRLTILTLFIVALWKMALVLIGLEVHSGSCIQVHVDSFKSMSLPPVSLTGISFVYQSGSMMENISCQLTLRLKQLLHLVVSFD